MVRGITLADEVWIATALLHTTYPNRSAFFNQEIEQKVKENNLYGIFRDVGVHFHISLHCVANKAANPCNYRMLYQNSNGTKRLFRSNDDYDPSRRTGKIIPNSLAIPPQYRYLLKWYFEFYNQGKPTELPIDTTTPPAKTEEEPKTDIYPPGADLKVTAYKFQNEQELFDFSYRCPKVAGS
ncbi:MAG: hypothetical protein GX638_03175, partial [Crenarchaeota archaeon]|nr:hypothetical protein [Thermoproteota archaeon]